MGLSPFLMTGFLATSRLSRGPTAGLVPTRLPAPVSYPAYLQAAPAPGCSQAGHVSFTRRIATTFHFEPSDREAELYERVSQLPFSGPTRMLLDFGQINWSFAARKILGSSVVAIAGFLEKVVEQLQRKQVADASTVEDLDKHNRGRGGNAPSERTKR